LTLSRNVIFNRIPRYSSSFRFIYYKIVKSDKEGYTYIYDEIYLLFLKMLFQLLNYETGNVTDNTKNIYQLIFPEYD